MLGRVFRVFACAVLAIVCLAPVIAKAEDGGNLRWKLVDGAQVKLDDKVPLTWNVLQTDKKKLSNLVLVLLGRRYLLLDTKSKLIYAIFPNEVHPDGQDLTSGDIAVKPHIIPSTSWTERDIGPAEEYRLILGDYGRTLSVQLPHPLDIRLGVY